MSGQIDLQAILANVGPGFAEGVAERDVDAVFVAEHYDVLKAREVFPALVPEELGGGGAPYSEMCAFLRGQHNEILEEIAQSGELPDDLRVKLDAALDAFADVFQSSASGVYGT